MFRFVIAFAISALVATTGVAAPDAAAVNAVMNNTISNFVRPGYAAFGEAVEEMGGKVSTLCDKPDETNLRSARDGFSLVAEKWADIEIIRFGPIAENNRFERILFYPDRKSTGLKQVQRILAKKDETAIDAEKLPKKSVAVQGLGALEFVLFGTGSEALASGEAFRCNYAKAITANLRHISDVVSKEWADGSPATRTWTQPGNGNEILREPEEAVNALLGTLVHGLEAIKDIRIGAFLKKEAKKDRPRAAIFRRSGDTMNVIAGNIRAVNRLLQLSDSKRLLDEEFVPVVSNVIFELDQAETVSRGLTAPIGEVLGDPEERGKLEYLKTSLSFAIKTLDQDFASAAGLSSGFSFSDGD